MNNIIVIFLLLFISNHVIAEDGGDFPFSSTALRIESDNLIIDRLKNRMEYVGAVTTHFDDFTLTTERLEVIFKKINDNKRTIDHIHIPNKLTVKRDTTNEVLVADSAKCYLNSKQIVFYGNVILQRGDNILKTKKLIYYVDLKNG